MRKQFSVLFAAVIVAVLAVGCASIPPPASGPPAWVDVSGGDGTVTFYVTRHGKTLFNTVGRAQGWSDTPLTKSGVEVAEQLGRGLAKKGVKFNAAWSSDSGRARETAHLALDNSGNIGIALQESANFRESGFGIFEGASDEEMWGSIGVKLGFGETTKEGATGIFTAMAQGKIGIDAMLAAGKAMDEESKTPTGMAEDFAMVQNRMRSQLTALAKEYAAKGGGNVLVVAHGISILAMVDDWITDASLRNNLKNGQLENASVTKVIYKDGTFTVTELNNMEYVEAGK
jgi:probable phosphoglycerate mutase